MPLFSELLPSAFPALALAHFVALLSPGPDFFLVVGHALRGGVKGTVFLCLGIALGNAAYIALAIAGWSGLRESPGLFRVVELAGAAYLLWIGFRLLKSARSGTLQGIAEASTLGPGAQLAAGLASALLNPKNAIFYLSLMTSIVGQAATLSQQALAGVWMASVVFVWDLGLAGVLSLRRHGRARKSGQSTDHHSGASMARAVPIVEGVAGVVLIGMGAWLAVKPVLPALAG